MTKSEFLESKGYEICYSRYIKSIDNNDGYSIASMFISIIRNIYYVKVDVEIETQDDIDTIQIAFNRVKSDFEEMQKYDD